MRAIVWQHEAGDSYQEIGKSYDVSGSGIFAFLKRRNLTKPARSRPIGAGLLRQLYVQRGYSTPRISAELGLPKSNIEYWMKKHKIRPRPLRKYERRKFREEPREKAYLKGLSMGDLYVLPLKLGIRVSTTTTHPAMIVLFRKSFEKYGKVTVTPGFNRGRGGHQWSVKVALDSSFSFMTKDSKGIPRWIRKREFIYFLAGLFDAEGSIVTTFRTRHLGSREIDLAVSLCNTNKTLLREVVQNLAIYHPRLVLSHKAGAPTGYGGRIRLHDLWTLVINRRASIRTLLSTIPIRHEEKVERARLVQDILDGCSWEEAHKRFLILRERIKTDVASLGERAREMLSNGRTPAIR